MSDRTPRVIFAVAFVVVTGWALWEKFISG